MEPQYTSELAQVIHAATPFLIALLSTAAGALLTYWPALAKGKRTPRREEIALAKKHEELKAKLRESGIEVDETPTP